jgi:hypothetical protein
MRQGRERQLGAGDEQHQSDSGEQHQERRFQASGDLLAKRLCRQAR